MLEFYGHTDVGKRRAHNEDTIYAHGNLFLVCDGMGGHNAGEVASRLAAEVIVDTLGRSPEDGDLGAAIKLANRAVFRKASSRDDYRGMGTTVAAVLVHPRRPQMTYGHVGDSRIYLVRAGSILQLVRDDTWAAILGPRAMERPGMDSMRHVLTKALGTQEEVDLDVDTQALQDGDAVLLCSDGLTNMLSDDDILDIISARRGNARAACEALVVAANAAGGHDNISAVVLCYRS